MRNTHFRIPRVGLFTAAAIAVTAIGLAMAMPVLLHHDLGLALQHVASILLGGHDGMVQAAGLTGVAAGIRQGYQTKGAGDDDDDPSAPPLTEIKTLLKRYGQTFEEFKKTNEEMLAKKADGKAVGDLEAKMATLNTELEKMGEVKQAVDELMLKLNRGSLGGGSKGEGDIEAEVKSFNLHRESFDLARKSAPLTVDEYRAYKGAYFNLVRHGSMDRLTSDERKAMLAGGDTDGGFLLPAPTAGRIVTRQRDYSPMRRLANVQTISTDSIEGVIDTGDADAGWVGETTSRDDTATPQVGKYKIEVFEMYAQPKATQKLLDDAAVDVEAWLANKVADKFTRVEGAAYTTGNGVNKPRGFCSYSTSTDSDDARAWGTLQHIITGGAGDFAASNPADVLFDVVSALNPAYQANAAWQLRRAVITKIRKFKGSDGQYLWQPSLQVGQPDRLLNYPLEYNEFMPALAAGSLSAALGDWMEGYTILDRIGIRVLRDPYTAKPYVRFYTTKRTGGGVLNFEAIKFLKFSAS